MSIEDAMRSLRSKIEQRKARTEIKDAGLFDLTQKFETLGFECVVESENELELSIDGMVFRVRMNPSTSNGKTCYGGAILPVSDQLVLVIVGRMQKAVDDHAASEPTIHISL